MTKLRPLLNDEEIAEVFERPVRRYKRYAEYRDSGIEWLGEVPKHWEMRRMADLANVTSGGTPSKDNAAFWNGDIPWVSPKDMKVREISDAIEHVSASALANTGLKLLQPPQVLIVVRGMILAHTFPTAKTTVPVTINQDMKALQLAAGIDPDYFVSLLEGIGDIVLMLIDEAGHGTKVLRTDLWRQLRLQLPPLDEQQAIFSFLRRETAKLDALISKKERLIELLQERRGALITHAVTKGLDPNVPMKDSGVEWLDLVPDHWTIRPLKRLLAHGPKNGISPPPADSSGVPPFSISAVRDGRVDVMSNLKQVALSPAEARSFQMRKRDLLLVRGNGNLDMVGLCGLVEEFPDGCTYPDILMLMRPRPDVLPEFLVATINGPYVRAQIEMAARTSNGTYKVSGDDVRSLLLVVPPLVEQQAITKATARFDDSIGRLVRSVLEAVDRLKELRSALITSAVTGKIDVREEPS